LIMRTWEGKGLKVCIRKTFVRLTAKSSKFAASTTARKESTSLATSHRLTLRPRQILIQRPGTLRHRKMSRIQEERVSPKNTHIIVRNATATPTAIDLDTA
jgi:hypothetical protein